MVYFYSGVDTLHTPELIIYEDVISGGSFEDSWPIADDLDGR